MEKFKLENDYIAEIEGVKIKVTQDENDYINYWIYSSEDDEYYPVLKEDLIDFFELNKEDSLLSYLFKNKYKKGKSILSKLKK